MGCRAPEGHCGALVAQDRGSEAARVADDGGQWWRRRSGEGVSSEKRECGGKEVRQRVNKIIEQSSGMFCGPERCWGCKQELAMATRCVAAGRGSGIRGVHGGGQQGRGTGPE
jgi:hypothetical protein